MEGPDTGGQNTLGVLPGGPQCEAEVRPRERGGEKEAEQQDALMPEDFQPHICAYDLDRLRDEGPAAASRAALGRAAAPGGRFWLHIDVDVLDELAFPAADNQMPGGLDWDELSTLLRPMFTSSALLGVTLSGYNPEKDEGSSCGLHLVDLFRALSE